MNTHNNTHLISTWGNARGTLYYTIGTGSRIFSRDGWFHCDCTNPAVIIGRNFRGRRFTRITTIHDVVDFVLREKAGK